MPESMKRDFRQAGSTLQDVQSTSETYWMIRLPEFVDEDVVRHRRSAPNRHFGHHARPMVTKRIYGAGVEDEASAASLGLGVGLDNVGPAVVRVTRTISVGGEASR
jgi:hypothetical protein